MDNRFTDRDSLSLSVTHKTHKYYDDHVNELYNNVSIYYNFKEGTSTPGWLRYFNNYKSQDFEQFQHPYQRMQGVEYQNGWEIGRHKIIAGFEWHRNSATDKANGYEGAKVNNKAFYLQDTIRLGDKWILVPGLRWDHSDEFGTNWSPKISTNYRADDKTKIYASWGHVYRTPSLAELYLVDDLTNYYGNKYVLANEGEDKLRAEKGHTETIGMEHNFDDNTAIAVNFFYSKISNAIWWTSIRLPFYDDADELSYYAFTHFPTNRDTQRRRGVEISFGQKIDDHFSYNLGYSHTKADSNTSSSHFMQPNGYRAGLHYKNRGLRVNLLGIMASGRYDKESTSDTYFPSSRYAVFDLNVIYDINPHAAVYFKANNFTNQNYTNASAYDCSPGRFFMDGATFRF